MGKITTPEEFYLAYLGAYPGGKILSIAQEADYQKSQQIMEQGLADYIGACTEQEKELFEFFGGEAGGKEPVSLEEALLSVHSRLGDLVARDFVGKLSMEDAAALIRILRAASQAEMVLGGCFDGVTVGEDDIIRHWCNTHAESRDEFLKMIGRG